MRESAGATENVDWSAYFNHLNGRNAEIDIGLVAHYKADAEQQGNGEYLFEVDSFGDSGSHVLSPHGAAAGHELRCQRRESEVPCCQ